MADRDLTPREVADALGVTVRTVQRWVSTGRLDAVRVGGRLRVSRSSLDAVRSHPAPVTQRPGAQRARRAVTTLLIANRGEVAVRIARTARAIGIRTIGVHTIDDRPPRGVDDVAVIGSYLDGPAIVEAVRRTNADAVHPGYGFLAENAEFARLVIAAGAAWVGPPPEAITAMGDKAAARRWVAARGVPTVPGYDGPSQDDETLHVEAARIGFPLLVKPSAGGGGKGMRIVRDGEDLAESLAAARREALRSFGDDRLVLERYLERARHVEVQVLFDAHGAGVDLGERDCSTQRRNQKIVEEAPAPSVTPEIRQRMADAALVVAASVGYVGAGTVEMLLTDGGEVFFLEMNTRLQVEHPVTEAVTDRDLVADQLRIAAGIALHELGLADRPASRGHAIEARLYAEDPEAGFLPATGRLLRVRWPPGVRVDTGVEEGDEVTDRFDPMLAKLVVHGPTRAVALERMRAALADTSILGVRTNLRFLRWLADEGTLEAGEMRTDTLGTLGVPPPPPIDDVHWRAAARALLGERAGDPWSGAWRLNAPRTVRVQGEESSRRIAVDTAHDHGAVASVVSGDGATAYVDVDGRSVEFRLERPPAVERAADAATAAGHTGLVAVAAPMPGRVIAVRAAAGVEVRARDPLLVLEAMKMEHAVTAPIDGRVTHLAAAEGQQVQRGDLLAEIEAT